MSKIGVDPTGPPEKADGADRSARATHIFEAKNHRVRVQITDCFYSRFRRVIS